MEAFEDAIGVPVFLALFTGGFLPLGLFVIGFSNMDRGLWWLMPVAVGVAWVITSLFEAGRPERSPIHRVLGQISLILFVGAIYLAMFLTPLGSIFLDFVNQLGKRSGD